MKTMYRWCGGLLLACAVLVCNSRPVAAQEPVASERLLPPEVLAFVTIPDVPDLKQRWNEALIGQLQRDPELAPFWQEVEAQINELSRTAEQELGLRLEELLQLPQGQIALAVTGGTGKPFGLIGLFEFGDNQAVLDTLLAKADGALQDEGYQKSAQDIEGTQVIQYDRPVADPAEVDDDDEEASGPSSFAYFVEDEHLVVGSGTEALRPVLARWDGKNPQSFAENQIYQYILEQCRIEGSSPVVKWFVNPVGLFTAAVMSGQGNNTSAMQVAPFLGLMPLLGLDRWKAMGGTFEMATGEFDSMNQMLLYVEPEPAGLLNVFRFPASRQAPPSWISADVNSYFSANWDVAGAYSAVQRLVDGFQGPGTFDQLIGGLSQQSDGPNVNIKTDLLDQLSGKFHVATDARDDDDPESQRVLFALELREPDKMRSTLARIAKTDGFPGETREFQGETIYELEQDNGTSMGVAVTEGHLVGATDVTALEQVLRSGSRPQPLSESPEYQRIAEHFPPETSMIGFQRADIQSKAAYQMLRRGDAGETLENLDFSKLPPYETLHQYLRPSGSYVVPDPRGARLVSFTLSETTR